jgi:putative transposase
MLPKVPPPGSRGKDRLRTAEIANRFKDYTSRVLRQEFAELRSRLPTLWLRSYYAATVGQVSETTVRRYLAAQATK